MKKTVLVSVMAIVGSQFLPFYAQAEETLDVSANVSIVSKYMWRGWNLNDRTSAQGGIDFAYKGFNAGTWGATDAALGTEIDVYLGYGFELSDQVSFDVGVVQYNYEGPDLVEWHVTGDFNLFSASVHFGEDDYRYYELNAGYAINDLVSIDFHIGSEDMQSSSQLTDFQVTLNYAFNDNYTVFLAATDKEDGDSEVYFGVNASF